MGVAKSRLCGGHEEPGPRRGDRAGLVDGEELIGCVLRTRDRVRPLFISAGHRVGLETAVTVTLDWLGRYRLPEPIRHADRLAGTR